MRKYKHKAKNIFNEKLVKFAGRNCW